MTKISKVLVLGSTGLIGHGICYYLVKKNFIVYGTSNKKNVKSINKNFKVYKNIDLTNPKSFLKIEKIIQNNNIQAIINSAALIPNKFNYKKKNFFQESLVINFISYIELYKILKKKTVKYLINISSPNVDNVKYNDLDNHHNFYIFTKYLSELFLSNLSNLKTNIVSLRVKSPYGYILDTKAVIPNFINRITKNKKIILNGEISKKKPFTFTEDIGAAIENIFRNNIKGVKNCIGCEQINIKNLSFLINEIFTKKNEIKNNKKSNYIKKYKYKNNINSLKTPIKDGLLKILKNEKNFQIFKMI